MARHIPTRSEELGLHLLVLRCQTGDERAFASLFEQFGERTLAYLRGLLGDAAEDAQQEVWLAVYRGLHSLTNPRAFRTWLFRTTRHRAVDYLRRLKRERELISDAPVETLESIEADEAPDVSELEAVIAELPAVQREVLLLRYQQELSYAEIALVVGCSIGTVRSRLHHAKRRVEERAQTLDRGDQ